MTTTINYKGHNLLSACVPTAEKIFPFGIARKSEAGRMIKETAQRWLGVVVSDETAPGEREYILGWIFTRSQGQINDTDARAIGEMLDKDAIRSLVAFAIRRGALNFTAARRLNDTDRKTFAGWALFYYASRVADRALSNGIYNTESRQIAARRANPENYANDKRGIAGALLGDRNLAAGCAR